MAGNIKGITIEFRGETTKLEKSLRTVDKETSSLDKNLRQVNNALKFNPTNIDLWRQKQELLTKKVQATEEKVKALKDAQAKMDASGVDKTSQEYQKLQRDIITTESKLKTFKGQLQEVGNVNLRVASEQIGELGNNLTSAGQKMQGLSTGATALLGSLTALAVKTGQWADDLNTMSKVYSMSTQELQKYQLAADLVDVSVETIVGSHAKLVRSMNSVTDETTGTGEAFAKLGVDIYDANGEFRDADDVWNDVITSLGKLENETERDAIAMQLMGRSAQELNPLIEDNGETFQNLAKIMEENNLEFLTQEEIDKANELKDKFDILKATGSLAFQQIGSKMADVLIPVIDKVLPLVQRLADYISNMNPETLKTVTIIAGIVAVVAPLLTLLGMLASTISAIMASPVALFILAIIGGIIQLYGQLKALMGVVDAVKTKWEELKLKLEEVWDRLTTYIPQKIEELKQKIQNGFQWIRENIITPIQEARDKLVLRFQEIRDKVGQKVDELRNKIKQKMEDIREKLVSPFEKAREKIDGIVSKIKGFFPINLGKFLNLKLPHISLKGGVAPFGIGGKGSLPSFDVDWYKTGGIFNKPTVIGVGEAGTEAVVPLDKFWNKLDGLSGGNTINMNVTVNGAENPEDYAKRLVKQMKLELRSL